MAQGVNCCQNPQLETVKAIERALYHCLYLGEATPCLYGFPKLHKEGVHLRPIVSNISFDNCGFTIFIPPILYLDNNICSSMVIGSRCLCYLCGYNCWSIFLTLIRTEEMSWISYETSSSLQGKCRWIWLTTTRYTLTWIHENLHKHLKRMFPNLGKSCQDTTHTSLHTRLVFKYIWGDGVGG